MNWQPIETAPKDGTWIIATCGAGFTPAVVSWNEEAEMWMLDEHIDDTWAGIDEWPLKFWMPMDALPAPPGTVRKSIMHCPQCGEIRLHDHQCTETKPTN